jgi:hypothetical protein
MVEIALAGIYSFASEPPNHSLLEDFLNKLKIFSYKVVSLVENIGVTKIIFQSIIACENWFRSRCS